MTDWSRQPNPRRRGTVYRSRPRLWSRRGEADDRPPSLRQGDSPPPSGAPGGGYDQGYGAGYDAGYGPGYDTGYDAGYGPGYDTRYDARYDAGYGPGYDARYGTDWRGGYGPGDQPGRGGPRGAGGGLGARRPRIRPRRVVLLLVLLLIGYPLGLFLVAWTQMEKVDALPSGTRPSDTPGRTYLVVGSDSRSALTPAERRRLGTGKATGARTDTIMLLHVPGGGGPTVLVSVPRDSYVSIPGHSKNKINSAYTYGGPQLLVRTVEAATGLHIDGYVETGLLGYADLVDAIGGVKVCVKKPMHDTKAHINLKAGCQTFDGTTALGYARARYSDPRGDLGRVERQRQVLAAIAGKTLSPSVVFVPWRSFPAAAAGGSALTVDDGTSPWGLVTFVRGMRNVAGGNGVSLTVPIGNPNLSTPVGSCVKWDSTKAKELFDALHRNDTEATRQIAEDQQKAATG